MAQNLTEDFVDLGSRCLSPNSTTELALNHIEGRLDVRAFVVVLQEGFPVEVIEVKHSTPQPVKFVMAVLLSCGIGLEGDIGRATYRLDCVEITLDRVSLVSRDLVDGEGLGGLVDQSGKLDIVGGCVGRGLNAGDDMGLDPAHDMRLNPILHTAFLAPLVVKPSGVGAGGEARRVNGKVGLNRPQRGGALLDEGLEQGRQFGVFKVTEGTGEGRRLGDQPIGFRFSQVGHKASAGHCGIDLGGDAEHDIGQWQPRSPEPVFGLLDAIAEVSEQGDKMLLLVGLSLVVGRPLLGAGHFDRLGVDRAAVWPGLPLYYELDGVNMLARQSPLLEVGAGAKRLAVVEVYDISPVARLGRDFPAQFVFLYFARVGYYQPSLYSCVHFSTPQLSLLCAYYTIQCIVLSIVFMSIFKKFICFSVLTSPYTVWYNRPMLDKLNDIQTRLAQLQEKGWTLAALADELGVTPNAVEKWKAGDRYPHLEKPVFDSLDRLTKLKRVPKKRRYQKSQKLQLPRE